MGHYSNNPYRNASICKDHDRWAISIPDYGEEEELEEEEEEEEAQ